MELLPDELPQVRIAECGCILLADSKPVGYRFKATVQGDVRVPVYCCADHDRTREVTEPAPTTPSKRSRKAVARI